MSNINLINTRIKKVEDQLTKSDKKITKVLQKDPKNFVYSSVSEIAKMSETSVAAVTRFTKKIGFSGLSELKISLSSELENHISNSIGDLDITNNDSAFILVRKIFEGNIEAIRDTERTLQIEDVVKTIKFIEEAKRVIFYGIGGSSSVAADAHHKFIRTGKHVDIVTDPHKQMVVSSITTSDDLIIAISHEGINSDLNETLKVAKKNKTKIVTITQFSNSPITKIADINLFTISREMKYRPESLTSRIAAHTITDVLYVGYSIKIGEQANQNLLNIKENMGKLKITER